MGIIRFRVAWWFKHHAEGCSDSVTAMLQNIADICTVSKPRKAVAAGKWTPPMHGSLKFNVDGSARGSPGAAGIGGVLRDHRGRVLGLFSRHIGTANAITAEIIAIHQACFLCVSSPNLIGKEITIISDSKAAVSWVNGTDFGSLNHVSLIYDIRSFLSILGGASVIFNPRSSNCFADSLAKKGSGMEGDMEMWEVV